MDSKIISYAGFCIRKGSVIFGADAIEVTGRKMYLLFVAEGTGRNTRKQINKIIGNKGVKGYIVKGEDLSDIIHRSSKVIAVTDRELAKAIEKRIKEIPDGDFWEITEVEPIDDDK